MLSLPVWLAASISSTSMSRPCAISDRRDRQPGNHPLADVVDAGLAGRVDLQHVDAAPLRNLDAAVALTAGIRRGALLAVERSRQDARRRRLAAAARPGKHEGVR